MVHPPINALASKDVIAPNEFSLRIVDPPLLAAELHAPSDEEYDWINQQLHQKAGEQSAEHGGGEAAHDVGAGAAGPEQRDQADERSGDCHGLGANALYCPIVHRVPKILPIPHSSPRLEP